MLSAFIPSVHSYPALRLALPSKGMEDQTLEFLIACGLRVNRTNPRQYQATIPAISGVEVLFQRRLANIGDRRRAGGRVGQESEEEAGFELAAAKRQDVERRRRQELERRQEHGEAVTPDQEELRREEPVSRRG